MSDDAARAHDDGEEGEGDAPARKEALNHQLLDACMRNDTEAAVGLIEQGADPCCEDLRQWSPLIWAASHGNEELTRLLIKHNAADSYKHDESQGRPKKKVNPLHWAAFKGHLKILWLLMAPPQSLSHHETDAIGNTPLHQAAAGGSLECAKCLMARGVDVFAKNTRGHTPYALCTVPEIQSLLQRAMSSIACKATGKQFSSTVLRYLCSWSHDVFCEAGVTQMYVYESPESEVKEKPVTWCTEVKAMIQDVEQQLNHALRVNVLETLTAALDAADNKPVDCKLVCDCVKAQEKLEAEIELGKAMQVEVVENLEEFTGIHENLSHAIGDAQLKNADQARIAAAKALRRKLMAEACLRRAVDGPQKTTVGHITMLEELTNAARGENANDYLLTKASKLIAKLKSEREVQQRIAETQPLCQLSSFKEAAKASNLPAWCHETENFENFHNDYKRVMETAEQDGISESLTNTVLEQLLAIERLLVERKQIEEEQRRKDAKKKKGKK